MGTPLRRLWMVPVDVTRVFTVPATYPLRSIDHLPLERRGIYPVLKKVNYIPLLTKEGLGEVMYKHKS